MAENGLARVWSLSLLLGLFREGRGRCQQRGAGAALLSEGRQDGLAERAALRTAPWTAWWTRRSDWHRNQVGHRLATSEAGAGERACSQETQGQILQPQRHDTDSCHQPGVPTKGPVTPQQRGRNTEQSEWHPCRGDGAGAGSPTHPPGPWGLLSRVRSLALGHQETGSHGDGHACRGEGAHAPGRSPWSTSCTGRLCPRRAPGSLGPSGRERLQLLAALAHAQGVMQRQTGGPE